MHLTHHELAAEGLAGLLEQPSPLAATIYSLYSCPPAADVRRRCVIVREGRDWSARGELREERAASLADACDFLWQVLHQDGRRIGQLITDREPQPGDYVLLVTATGYRVAGPATLVNLADQQVGAGAAPVAL